MINAGNNVTTAGSAYSGAKMGISKTRDGRV